jgi:hypothetical protein
MSCSRRIGRASAMLAAHDPTPGVQRVGPSELDLLAFLHD